MVKEHYKSYFIQEKIQINNVKIHSANVRARREVTVKPFTKENELKKVKSRNFPYGI